MGVVVVLLLRWFAFLLRLIGSIVLNLGNLLINIYDFLIIPFLWIESLLQKKIRVDSPDGELHPQKEAV
jgi:hypothetical protein